MSTTIEELRSRTNIHDYLDRIGAEPPPVDANEARKSIIWCNSVEEAAEVIFKLDEAVER